MPTRNVDLTGQLDRFVRQLVKRGRYESASEVVRTALQTLERKEQTQRIKLAALRSAIDDGDASGTAGGYVFARPEETQPSPARVLSVGCFSEPRA